MAETSGIKPQPGPQEVFLASPADLAIYGGAAGGGKSFALLLEATRHINNPKFGAVIFRRNSTDILKEGALWDESQPLYGAVGGVPREGKLDWSFPSGAAISFSHLEHENTVYAWQGSQIPLIAFDELTHFTKKQFWYMFSRNRSTCGIRPYVRASCNPDPDSFVAGLVAWYIDPETGYALPERSGVIRYFVRQGEDIIWADHPQELLDRYTDLTRHDVKSFTFVASSVFDNQILLDKDPGYLGNLKAQDVVNKERLLRGNWKIRPAAGLLFNRSNFPLVDAAPAEARRVRSWDLAATTTEEGVDPDWTVGLRLSRDAHGTFYVEHVERFRGDPNTVESKIMNIAANDGRGVHIHLPQDPGQAGKSQAKYLINKLAGYNVTAERETGDKVTRASPASAQAGAGNIRVVRGAWNEAFFTELESFPSPNTHDDQVDGLSGAFNALIGPNAQPNIRSL
ncbi:phage terminase large subunit [Gemmata sp. G18]|uniref:Phage terminase large subunit n=1 Tax=Gemmata palustris TaxID=2822762 RepID=A0ABS5BX89_9BACT|nr:phage terminase large subunit [Gemmata palustris]MBP3958356.1 phage terminase large subunit [Gemmata palustris]